MIFHKLTKFVDPPVHVSGIDEIDDAARREELEGKHLLVVEDLMDSGLTMKCLLAKLQTFDLASLRTVIAFNMRDGKQIEHYTPDYLGFEIDR